jgi:hypothetical protein
MMQMPQSRVLLYIFVLSLIPIVFALIYYQSQSRSLETLESRIQRLQAAAVTLDRKQAANALVRNYFAEADRFYLEKQTESLRLLETETDALQKLGNQPYIAEDPRITRRLNALADNTVIFSEGMVQSYSFFNEIPEALQHPIEVDVDDIKKLLTKIEGVTIGTHEPGPNRPQLIVTDFRLDRKSAQGESDLYTLNLKILKREYL